MFRNDYKNTILTGIIVVFFPIEGPFSAADNAVKMLLSWGL